MYWVLRFYSSSLGMKIVMAATGVILFGFQLFRRLAERYPAIKPHLEEGLAVAIDGQIYQDAWLQPIPPDSEVHLLPQIGGG